MPALAGQKTVFVSYARADSAFALKLAEELEARGVSVWIDRQIRAGSRWDEVIHDAILAATAMVVVLSRHSVRSPAVHDEFSLALDDGDLVVPVLLERCDVPLRLRTLQHVDFTGNREQALSALLERLTEHADSMEPVAASKAPDRDRKRRSASSRYSAIVCAGAVTIAAFASRDGTPRASHGAALPGALASKGSPSLRTSSVHRAGSTLGDEVILKYRTLVDSRARWLSVKSHWQSAAESFAVAAADPELADGERAELLAKAAFARGRFELLEGRLETAAEELARATAGVRDWAPPHLELVTLYARRGEYPKAHEEARRALEVEPDLWLARAAEGSVYAAEGKMLEAIGIYEAALQTHETPLVLANLALAYHAAHLDDARAAELATRALARDPDLVAALTVLAEEDLEHGRAERALERTQRMVDVALFDVTAWLLHGDALLALGRREPARLALQRAVELFEQTHQTGAPARRLEAVRKALAAGELPQSRRAMRSFPRTYPAARRPSLPSEPVQPAPEPLLSERSRPKNPLSIDMK